MTIDLISDMITRLRNAAIINKKLISLPFNKNNYIIIKILEREGYIFCSTFINNKDKLFLKLLELIFIKKNFSYNDTRVKNLLFFIRDFVKIHQQPENIKKYSKSEKKTLSFLNTIDNNLIKSENFFDSKDLGDPMSLLISKFRNSYLEHKKIKSSNSSSPQSVVKEKTSSLFSSPIKKENKTNQREVDGRFALNNQELQAVNSKTDTTSSLAFASFSSKDLKISRRELQENDLRLLLGDDGFDNMDINFYISHLSSSTLELKKKLDNIYSNLNKMRVNNKSNHVTSYLARFSAATHEINKTLHDMYSNLTLGLSPIRMEDEREKNEINQNENIFSTLANFQKSLDETHSLIPMPISMRKMNKNININDLEFSLTKLNKQKDDINFYLFQLSKNTDNLQFYIKRSYQQVAKLNLNLRINKSSNELNIIANVQQKQLEDLKDYFQYEFKKNLDDIIFYFTRLTKIVDIIISTFNLTELKKYFGIKFVQVSTARPHLPSIKIQLENNLNFVTSKFNVPSLTHLLSNTLEFSNNHQIDDINSYISNLLVAILESNDIKEKKNSRKTIGIKLENSSEQDKDEQFNFNNSSHSFSPDLLSFSLPEQIKREIGTENSKEFINKEQFKNGSTPSQKSEASGLSPIFSPAQKREHFSPRSLPKGEIDGGNSSSFFSSPKGRENASLFSQEEREIKTTGPEKTLIDKSLKMNEKSKKLKKRLKPEEKMTYYYDPIQGKNTFLPLSLDKNEDSINSSISPFFSPSFSPKKNEVSLSSPEGVKKRGSIGEKKEYNKPLNLQKYLRKKNNKTFQTLFNPNFSKIILLALNLNAKEKASIHGIRRISKPSLRCYSSNPIPRSFGGLGVFIVSTNCGIMTDNEAREKKLGGEIMLEIW